MKKNNCFEKYKNFHFGESVFVIGTGPTLVDFFPQSDQYENIVKIGCNALVYSDDVELDYYFIGDPQTKARKKSFISDPQPYRDYKPKIEKFCRLSESKPHCLTTVNGGPLQHAKHYSSARYSKYIEGYYPLDIVTEPINPIGSISMDMMQFALFAGFKTIFLLGQDCNYNQKTAAGAKAHFNEDALKHYETVATRVVRYWEKMAKFIENEHKDVQIFSVNPISLKFFNEISYDKITETNESRRRYFGLC